jgi:hypothetical protein
MIEVAIPAEQRHGVLERERRDPQIPIDDVHFRDRAIKGRIVHPCSRQVIEVGEQGVLLRKPAPAVERPLSWELPVWWAAQRFAAFRDASSIRESSLSDRAISMAAALAAACAGFVAPGTAAIVFPWKVIVQLNAIWVTDAP